MDKNILDKSLKNIVKTWQNLLVDTKDFIDSYSNKEINIEKLIDKCLNPIGGEVRARNNTIELANAYTNFSLNQKEYFFKILSSNYDTDRYLLKKEFQKYLTENEEEKLYLIELEIKKLLDNDRIKILKQFNSLPNGVKFLVNMRADLIKIKNNDISLNSLDNDFKRLLSSWFDIGLLDLHEINWSSPAELLEKLICYEAVHAISSWDDLKNRLDSDRKCYSFFHHKMPEEPLIFVEVALSKNIETEIDKVLDINAPRLNPNDADTAIFYSISNTQPGLAGIYFGNFLIKRVVENISNKFKSIKNFITLSPVPSFRKWLDTLLLEGREDIFTEEEKNLLNQMIHNDQNKAIFLYNQLQNNFYNKDFIKIFELILKRLCTAYLVNEKSSYNRSYDPVAHFHFSNGASLEKVNFLADKSAKGIKQSYSIMVNYLYNIKQIDENYELYTNNNEIIISNEIKNQLRDELRHRKIF